ncbi:MAG: IlvD/Edd family dehydratase [Gammaproteobacteria bacterium]
MSNERGLRRNLTRYGDDAFSLFLRKAFIKAMGYTDDALDRTIVGIVNTASGYNACHRNVPELVDAVKRGVMLGGALPVDFPVISLHESFAYPTSMYLRNLMSMDVEEMIRAQPMDAVVLVGGCDKTVPALLMGAASAGKPAIVVVTGPMSTGAHRGERIGACTDCRRLWGEYRAGNIDDEQIAQVTDQLVPSAGTCGVMGTASTMALMTEAMGMMLPGGAAIPATHADRARHAERSGRAAVALAERGDTPERIMTPASLRNAMRVLQAIGGSTNGLVHLAAIGGRLGIELDLDEFHEIGRATPVLVDLKPSGQHYMEDLYRAGGLTPVLRELAEDLETDCLTVTGQSLRANMDAAAQPWDQNIVRTRRTAIYEGGGMAVLSGTLAPGKAVIKQAAASPELLQHKGRAVVFDSLEDLAQRIDRDDLDVQPEDVLVLRNAGPRGAPGMPESGYIPIPRKLAQRGVKDMVRISDARMSGTAFGTIVLHVTPESAAGGPLALVRDGDGIHLDTAARKLDLDVPAQELDRRRAAWQPTSHEGSERGYLKLFLEHVNQADQGCDFDFLRKR